MALDSRTPRQPVRLAGRCHVDVAPAPPSFFSVLIWLAVTAAPRCPATRCADPGAGPGPAPGPLGTSGAWPSPMRRCAGYARPAAPALPQCAPGRSYNPSRTAPGRPNHLAADAASVDVDAASVDVNPRFLMRLAKRGQPPRLAAVNRAAQGAPAPTVLHQAAAQAEQHVHLALVAAPGQQPGRAEPAPVLSCGAEPVVPRVVRVLFAEQRGQVADIPIWFVRHAYCAASPRTFAMRAAPARCMPGMTWL